MLEIATLMHDCAPAVAPDTLRAIIRTESGFDPLALHINGNVRLKTPPRTVSEAISWSGWLIGRGYSIDLGLMQVNSRNLARLRMTLAQAFDPCWNIRAGATLLAQEYRRAARVHGPGTGALLYAISAYNTGNWQAGLRNGYVARVALNAGTATAQPRRHNEPATADTAITGFGGGYRSSPSPRSP